MIKVVVTLYKVEFNDQRYGFRESELQTVTKQLIVKVREYNHRTKKFDYEVDELRSVTRVNGKLDILDYVNDRFTELNKSAIIQQHLQHLLD